MNDNCKMSEGKNLGDVFEALADACRRDVKSLVQSHLALVSIIQSQADIHSSMEKMYRYKAENSWCYLLQIWYYRKYYKARRARIFMERQVFGLRRFATIIGDNEE